MKACVVAVDVGNSAIKLGVRQQEAFDFDDPLLDRSIGIDQPDWDLSVIDWVHDQLGCQSVQWRIASVHRPAADQLRRAIAQSPGDPIIHLITRHDIPMRLDVDHPDQLGIDRLVGAHAASERFGAPLVVVDAGSAVTVDWVDSQGTFHGGAILPGMALQFASLATGTDALPRIDCQQAEPLRMPAKNTSEAIQLGVLTGIAATIDRLARCYGKQAGLDENAYRLILTGGDAAVLSRLLTHSHLVTQNLVCRGLLDLPRSSLSGTNPQQQLE